MGETVLGFLLIAIFTYIPQLLLRRMDKCNIAQATNLQKLQNRILQQILTFSSYDANSDSLIKILGWKKGQLPAKSNP